MTAPPLADISELELKGWADGLLNRHPAVGLVSDEMFCCHGFLLYLKLLITLSWANDATSDPAWV